MINDLLAHQTDRMDIQMVLLSYSLIIDDMETGGRIYEAVVHKLSKSRVEQNADLRKLLMFATLRYKDAAEAKEADRKSMDKDSGFTPLKATNRTTAAAVSLP